jgi:hypothetical protein
MAKFTVSGPYPFRGHAPGKSFEAEPDEVTSRAVARGSIREVKPRSKPAGEAPETPAKPEKE